MTDIEDIAGDSLQQNLYHTPFSLTILNFTIQTV
jgi:hypothetical protein